MSLKPEIIDFFRLHEGKIFKDVQNFRRFDPILWDRMRRGEEFVFDSQRGLKELADACFYEFPMKEYLLSREGGMSLKKILGSNVKIVTQRNLLKDLMYLQLRPKNAHYINYFQFERFGDVLFVKHVQINRCLEVTNWDRFLENRRNFFKGDDLPGCIGSTPVDEFDFPDVGSAYSVLSIKRGNSRILYSCLIKNFSPEGEPVDSTLSRNRFSPSFSKQRAMFLNAATDGYKHHMFFKMQNGTAQMDFPDTEAALRDNPIYHEVLNKALDLLLDKRILKFLANRRGCAATIEYEPELRLKPQDFPKDYNSFLSTEFFMRFYDEED